MTSSSSSVRRVCGLVLALVSICGCGTSPSSATHDYWDALAAISARIDEFGTELEATSEGDNPGRTLLLLRRAESEVEQAINEVAALPVDRVDPEAVEYGAEVVVVGREMQSLFGDLGDLVERGIALNRHSNSADAAAEAFVRGFFGDPFGKHDELVSASSQLNSEANRLFARYERLERRTSELEAQEIRLRSRLSERHGGEFVSLTQPIARPGGDGTGANGTKAEREPPKHPIARIVWNVFHFIYGWFGPIGVLVVVALIAAAFASERASAVDPEQSKADSNEGGTHRSS